MQFKTIALVIAFAATIPAANWLIGHIGTICVPNGPCLIPVGFGLMAPSGVAMIGIALVLRDLVQKRSGVPMALAAIAIGGVLSFTVAPPSLAVASALSFLLSELTDLAVYTPLARKRMAVAVVASGIVGAVVDSAMFLWLAFGSLDLMAGQVVGKLYASIAFAGWMLIAARRERIA